MSFRPYAKLGDRKPPKTGERALKNELTILVSRIVRLSQPYCCLCGENNWQLLHCGHFFHRDMPPTEFDLENLSTLCALCNKNHEFNPEPYRAYMLETLGVERFNDLAQRAHAQTKMGFVELFELREQMRARYAEAKLAAA